MNYMLSNYYIIIINNNNNNHNLCFRACQHLRSLAPIMNNFFMTMMANDIRGWLGPKFS